MYENFHGQWSYWPFFLHTPRSGINVSIVHHDLHASKWTHRQGCQLLNRSLAMVNNICICTPTKVNKKRKGIKESDTWEWSRFKLNGLNDNGFLDTDGDFSPNSTGIKSAAGPFWTPLLSCIKASFILRYVTYIHLNRINKKINDKLRWSNFFTVQALGCLLQENLSTVATCLQLVIFIMTMGLISWGYSSDYIASIEHMRVFIINLNSLHELPLQSWHVKMLIGILAIQEWANCGWVSSKDFVTHQDSFY